MKHPQQVAFALSIIVAMSCLGNKDNKIPVRLKIGDDLDRPVEGADIYSGGIKIGSSNENGQFSGQVLILSGQKKAILEIRKVADTQLYYADTKVEVRGIAPSEEPINVKLISVPKIQHAENEGEKEPQSQTSPTSDVAGFEESSDQNLIEDENKTAATVAINTATNEPENSAFASNISESISPKSTLEFTIVVHAHQNRRPLLLTKIWVSNRSQPTPTVRCITNQRGRCTFKMPQGSSDIEADSPSDISIIAQKDGFTSVQKAVTLLKNLSEVDIELTHGRSIDFFVFESLYSRISPVPGAKIVGLDNVSTFTDAFGFATLIHPEISAIPKEVVISAAGMFNATVATDTSATATGLHTVPLTRSSPRVASVGIARINVIIEDIEVIEKSTDDYVRQISEITEKTIFAQSPNVAYARDPSSKPDYLISLAVNLGKTVKITATLTNENNKIVSGKIRNVEINRYHKDPEGSVHQLILDMLQSVPFEISNLGVSDKQISFNIGKGRLSWLAEKKIIAVGLNDAINTSSHCEILEVWNELFTCRIPANSKLENAKVGERFFLFDDPAKFGRPVQNNSKKWELWAIDKNKIPIKDALVFLNSTWIGETGSDGKLTTDAPIPAMSSVVVRHKDFLDFVQPLSLPDDSARHQIVAMHEITHQLHVTSEPNHVAVYVNGFAKGKTPISIGLENSGDIKLELRGAKNFKDFTRVISTKQIDNPHEGIQTHIVLSSDFRQLARDFVTKANFKEAITELSKISSDQEDFLFAQHDIGEIYLLKLNEPENAMKVFDTITAQPNVANYSDLRFVSAFINAAISRYLAAERLPPDQVNAATEYYRQCHKILNQLLESNDAMTKFVGHRHNALSEVRYYAALSLHKQWLTTNDPKLAFFVRKAWNNFLQEGKASKSGNSDFFLRNKDNALTYMQYVGQVDRRPGKEL